MNVQTQQSAPRPVPSVYESENLDRVRTRVEILVEFYMKKLGPDSDNLKPRQHLALDRQIARLTRQILAEDYSVFHEFEFRLFVIAYRAGKLTPELWSQFRHMRPMGDPRKFALASLFQEVMGRPVTRAKARRHGWPLHGEDLESEMLLLRKAFDNPAHEPSARERYAEMLDTLSEADLALHLMAWVGALAVQLEKRPLVSTKESKL